jgi:dihydrofolate synthase/folylpolyglutamate synthase
LGFVNDKKIDEVNLLPENSEFYFAKPSINRGRHPEDYEYLLRRRKFFIKFLILYRKRIYLQKNDVQTKK